MTLQVEVQVISLEVAFGEQAIVKAIGQLLHECVHLLLKTSS